MDVPTETTSAYVPSRWAIIIGIDCYSTQKGPEERPNLRGCANDAVLVYNFHVEELKVPSTNIFLHLERHPDLHLTDPKHLGASLFDVCSSIKTVTERARKGHFVHIHFSGHGFRGGNDKPSEYLVFRGAKMKDVDFGKRLDDLSRAGEVAVLVTLDCCFSGGATRYDQLEDQDTSIRSNPEPDDNVDDLASSDIEDDDYDRQVTLQKGELYRDRDYTVMTACQPHEKAGEWHISNNKYGAFTWSFIYQLKEVCKPEHSMRITTYEMLHGVLEATVLHECDKKSKSPQHPTLFGPRDRVLLGNKSLEVSRDVAIVTRVENDRLKLNRGRVSGAKLGDRYRIDSLGKIKDDDAIEVVVIADIEEYHCYAVLPGERTRGNELLSMKKIGTLKTGRLARLIERKSLGRAAITHDNKTNSVKIVAGILTLWPELRHLIVPIDIVPISVVPNAGQQKTDQQVKQEKKCPWFTTFFGKKKRSKNRTKHPDVASNTSASHQQAASATETQFNIVIKQEETFTAAILDSRHRPFPFVVDIQATFSDLPKRLMGVLRHLQSYALVSELKSPFPIRKTKLSIELIDVDMTQRADRSSLYDSERTLTLHNKTGQTLYVTVFNLTPLYGITQVFPNPTGEGFIGGRVVTHDTRMEQDGIPIKVKVPPSLAKRYREDPSFEMKDVIKVFVTTEPTDLRHYELDDLVDIPTEDWTRLVYDDLAEEQVRHVDRPVQESGDKGLWWVKEFPIVTKGLKA